MDKTTVYDRSSELQAALSAERQQGRTIGFVPTMGALHQGHLALVERAMNECDTVVVSIFVNPTQFNNPTDLEKYPRMLQNDIDLLDSLSPVMVFAPEYEEVYIFWGSISMAWMRYSKESSARATSRVSFML
jgi:pantoate--beta-alanine ligase